MNVFEREHVSVRVWCEYRWIQIAFLMYARESSSWHQVAFCICAGESLSGYQVAFRICARESLSRYQVAFWVYAGESLRRLQVAFEYILGNRWAGTNLPFEYISFRAWPHVSPMDVLKCVFMYPGNMFASMGPQLIWLPEQEPPRKSVLGTGLKVKISFTLTSSPKSFLEQ